MSQLAVVIHKESFAEAEVPALVLEGEIILE
jgi:hypothetical protein